MNFQTFEWLNRALFEELVPNYSQYGEESIHLTARKDWKFCAENKPVMTYEDFALSLLTLAENFTTSSNHQDYWDFLDKLLNKLKSKLDAEAETLASKESGKVQRGKSLATDSGESDDGASPKHTAHFLIQRRLVPTSLTDIGEGTRFWCLSLLKEGAGASVADSEPGFDFIHQEVDKENSSALAPSQVLPGPSVFPSPRL
eukprot:610950-Hanusia_phi.AAC.2